MADSFETRMIRRRSLPFLSVKTGAEKTYAVRRHSHKTLSVGFVEEGSSVISCHPLEFSMDTGDAILIPPETIHLCQPKDPERFRFRMLYICPDWLKESLGLDAAVLTPQTAHLSSPHRAPVSAFFATLQNREDSLLDETNAILFLDRLFTKVFQGLSGRAWNPPPNKRQMNPEDLRRMDRVKRFLDENFDRDIQLDDLADIAGTGKYALLRQFKQQWQITPHAYVINCRIHAAKAMLKEGHSVADTAVACGFFDQSHFVKTFKNFVGIRPADYPG